MKTIINKVINNKIFDGIMNAIADPFITIFTLHRASPANDAYNGTDEKLLARCLDYATKNNYEFLSIDQIVKDALQHKKYSRPTLCFTLDDGYTDQLTRLVPVLLEYKTEPTLFVVTDFIDNKDWIWDAKLSYIIWNTPMTECTFMLGAESFTIDLSSPEKRKTARRFVISKVKKISPDSLIPFIESFAATCKFKLPKKNPAEYAPTTWDQLRSLETQGLHIGSHTQSHLVLNSANDERISSELTQAKARITQELRSPSQVFCYPLGTIDDFSMRHESLVKAAGYSAAITTTSSTTNLKQIAKNPYQINRIGFPFSFDKFVRYASWAEAARSKLSI